MTNHESTYRKVESSRFAFNATSIIFLVLFLAAAVTAFMFYQSSDVLKKASKEKTDSIKVLESQSIEYISKIKNLDEKAFRLESEALKLDEARKRLIQEKDSVTRLLAYTRANERNAKAKIAQLQKQLTSLQGRLNDVQQKYDDLLQNSGVAGEDLQKQIQLLTAERNQLAEENQRLQRELLAATGNADNRTAIFTTNMNSVPGEVKRGRFSSSKRSQNMDRVEVAFTLSRPPKPTENLIFKIFDGANKEIPIKPRYRNELNAPADPTNQKVILEFESGFLDRRAEGTYSVRLFLTDINKGLEDQEIGISQFEVK